MKPVSNSENSLSKRKRILVKQGEEYYLVWANHRITKRKIEAGIFEPMPSRISINCLESYRKGFKIPNVRAHKYTFVFDNFLPNVVCRVQIRVSNDSKNI
jgi:hypothetical protein